MVGSLHIVDLKGIRDLTVPLGALTVLVGPNGVGKTTVLESVFLLGSMVSRYWGEADAFFQNGRWSRGGLIRGASESLQIRAALASCEIGLDVPRDGKVSLFLAGRDGRHLERRSVPSGWVRVDVGASATKPSGPQQADTTRLSGVRRLRLDVDRIAAPSPIVTAPDIQHDGSGLPAYLQYLHGLRDGSLENIEAALQTIVPRFRRVQFRPVEITSTETEILTVDGQELPRNVTRKHSGVELLADFDDATGVPAAHISEGTLLTLAILALVHGSRTPQRSLILIDDIDRALHPSAQHRLIKALYGVLQATPDLQILATTHSPDLVDACEAADVRVMGRDANGDVAARSLTEHPEAAKWLKLLRVGEFWGSVGEDWVAGTGAGSE